MARKIFLWITLISGVFSLAFLFLFTGAFARSNLLPPFLRSGPVRLSFLSMEAAFQKLEEALEKYQEQPLLFIFQGEVAKIPLAELGVIFDAKETSRKIPAMRTRTNFHILFDTFSPRNIPPVSHFAYGKIAGTLEKQFSQIKLMRNASFSYEVKTKKLMIEKEQEGFTFKREALTSQLEKHLADLSSDPIFLTGESHTPTVFETDLVSHKDFFLKRLPPHIFLRSGNKKWKFDFPRDIAYLDFQKASFLETNRPLAELPEIFPTITEEKLEQFLETNEIPKALERPKEGRKIYRNVAGAAVFEGRGERGVTIDRFRLRALFEKALNERLESVEIPLLEEEAPLEIAEDLQHLGIRELIGVGYTTFVGSPPNRKHNIRVGVERFNGSIIKPGEIFSFNEHLGPVEAYTGYKPELVIKSDGTKPEYGGGLCQVSTTMYRAVLFSGLPILERSPHSYAVTYYSQVLGHGLDATIYPGVKDLKFLNDTPGSILVNSYVEGDAAYFKFYGTSDERKVAFEGPFISNKRAPGPDEIVYTKELPLGKKKLQEKPHGGFDALWYRSVTNAKGETTKETIFSRYRAVPAKYLMGGEGPSTADPALEAARRFE